MNNCICSAKNPVCEKCGHKWGVKIEFENSTVYTDKKTIEKFDALYGKPKFKFSFLDS